MFHCYNLMLLYFGINRELSCFIKNFWLLLNNNDWFVPNATHSQCKYTFCLWMQPCAIILIFSNQQIKSSQRRASQAHEVIIRIQFINAILVETSPEFLVLQLIIITCTLIYYMLRLACQLLSSSLICALSSR